MAQPLVPVMSLSGATGPAVSVLNNLATCIGRAVE